MIITLPLNENPLMRTYPTYSYVEHVANNQEITGCVIAEFELFGYQKNQWKKSLSGINLDVNGDVISICVEPYSTGDDVEIFRECQEKDEIKLKINRHLITNPWCSICLFISPLVDDTIVEDPSHSYIMHKFPNRG